VESTPFIPAPPVAVIDPSESVPSAATFNATMELFAELVMKYNAFAFVGVVVEPVPDPFPFPPPRPLLAPPFPLPEQTSDSERA
jgi:hypothetical protein